VSDGRVRRVASAGSWILIVAVAYYVAARVGLVLALFRGQVTPLWPSAGIALVCLLLFGSRVWPGITLGAFLVHLPIGLSIPAVTGIAVGNTLAPVCAYLLLRRSGFRTELDRLQDVLALIVFAALGGMTVSATVGAAVLVLTQAIPAGDFWSTWSMWWTGDAMGVLVVAPLLLVVRRVGSLRGLPVTRLAEASALIGGTALVAWYATHSSRAALYLVFPLLIWAASRFQMAGAALCVFIVSVAAIHATTHESGPFAGAPILEKMIRLQAFNGATALTALLLAAMATERNRARRAVERAGRELERRVVERTAELAATIERLGRSEALLAEAQHIGEVGSWEWDVAADTLVWTDQLFRLYGMAPQSTPLDCAALLERAHPDDRPAIRATLGRASHDHRPFRLEYRVVWPDGSVRWLDGRGSVVADRAGKVVKVVGTAQDITETKLAEEALARSEEKFRRLVASSPDAVVGVGASGRIVLANNRTEQLFGYSEGELLGRAVEELIPDRFRGRHELHRGGYLSDPRTRPVGLGLELFALRKDRSEFPVDIALSPIETEEGVLILAAVRDVTEQRRADQAARELREAEFKRRQALEINDSLVQRLTVAVGALEGGDAVTAARALSQTVGAARQMMTNLGKGAALAPGDLVRTAPATVPGAGEPEQAAKPPASSGVPGAAKPPASSGAPVTVSQPIGVVVADDAPDIRLLLRMVLESNDGFAVLGEAADGAEAVRLVAELRPDAVVLDLAMPVMDGLEALAEIRRRSPETKVVVFSGYGKDQAAARALELGAAAYLEKGGAIQTLVTLLSELFRGRLEPARA